MAQLTNNTKDKLAYVLLKTDSGLETVEYIASGVKFSKNYDTKNLDIKVIYLDNKVEPSIDVINGMKNFVRKIIINDNGKLKSKPLASIGVRS